MKNLKITLYKGTFQIPFEVPNLFTWEEAGEYLIRNRISENYMYTDIETGETFSF